MKRRTYDQPASSHNIALPISHDHQDIATISSGPSQTKRRRTSNHFLLPIDARQYTPWSSSLTHDLHNACNNNPEFSQFPFTGTWINTQEGIPNDAEQPSLSPDGNTVTYTALPMAPGPIGQRTELETTTRDISSRTNVPETDSDMEQASWTSTGSESGATASPTVPTCLDSVIRKPDAPPHPTTHPVAVQSQTVPKSSHPFPDASIVNDGNLPRSDTNPHTPFDSSSRNPTSPVKIDGILDRHEIRKQTEKQISHPVSRWSDLPIATQLQIIKTFRGYHNSNRKKGPALLAEAAWAEKHAPCMFKYLWIAKFYNTTADVVRDIMNASAQVCFRASNKRKDLLIAYVLRKTLKLSRAQSKLAKLQASYLQEDSPLSDLSDETESQDIAPTTPTTPNEYDADTTKDAYHNDDEWVEQSISTITELTTAQKQAIIESYFQYNDDQLQEKNERVAQKTWSLRRAAMTGKCNSCNMDKMCVVQPNKASCTRCWNMGLECSYFISFKHERVARSNLITVEVLSDILSESSPKTLSALLAHAGETGTKIRRKRLASKNTQQNYSRREVHINYANLAASNTNVSHTSTSYGPPSIVDSLKEIVMRLEGTTGTNREYNLPDHGMPGAIPTTNGKELIWVNNTPDTTLATTIDHRTDGAATGISFATASLENDNLTKPTREMWNCITKAKENLQAKDYAGAERYLQTALQHRKTFLISDGQD
ncbi:hypothetical protein V5O48_001862 [Marasmius crinis-equi]|uniref:Zn(2)-C6 fungal-type domain-containing protein n=1 Tax=Marasmius crinis-equi TaxID=585013 RepID=A0ABR3FXM5_9AGAR